MADFYWVGGSGNWSAYATHWATTSGGSTFRTNAPTSADNVFFDNNSAAGTFTVTIDVANAVCKNFDASGITNATYKMTLTGTASVGLLQVNGNWTNPSSTYFAWTTWTGAQVTFAATGTITTNAVSFAALVLIQGSGITVTLGGAFTGTLGLNLSQGTFDTNSTSNYSYTNTNIQMLVNANTRSLNLNASSLTLSGTAPYADNSAGGFTLNAGTSTITCSNASPTFAGNGQTFYNVTFSSTAIGTVAMTGANTFNNLTFAARAAGGLGNWSLSNNVTINGTLTTNSGSSATPDRRLRVNSATGTGTQYTISAAAVSLTNTDFRDMVAAGAASPFTGTSLGNLLNCSNITFTSAKTVYWSLTAGGNWNATAWATGSGLSPAAANFPLAQDTCIIDDTGLTAGNTITLGNNWPIGTLTSTRTGAWTFAIGAFVPNIYGNVTFDANLTITVSTGSFQFFGQGTNQTIKSNGISLPASANIATGSGSFRLDGNLTLSSASTFTLTSGALDLTNNGAGNYTLSTGLFVSTNSNTRAITFGTGNITLTGTSTAGNITIWNMNVPTNFSYTGTPNVYLTGNSTANTRTLQACNAAQSENNAISFIITSGSDTITFGNGSSVKTLDFYYGGSGTFTGTLSNNGTLVIYGDYILKSGMTLSSGTGVLYFGAASSTSKVTSNGLTLDFPVTIGGTGSSPVVQLQDNLTLGSTRTLGLTTGTLDVNGKTLTASTFTNTGIGTRAITFNGGTISLSGSGSTVWNASGSGFTTSAGTGNGTISLTSASAKTFAGGEYTYAAALNQGGAGTLTVTGSNTFSGLSNSAQPATITITAGTTQTFTGPVTLAGTSGNLITLNSSTPGTKYTFTYPTSTTVSSLSYCSITDCIGYENAYWQAYQINGNVNGGNNLGWIFASLRYNSSNINFFG